MGQKLKQFRAGPNKQQHYLKKKQKTQTNPKVQKNKFGYCNERVRFWGARKETWIAGDIFNAIIFLCFFKYAFGRIDRGTVVVTPLVVTLLRNLLPGNHYGLTKEL